MSCTLIYCAYLGSWYVQNLKLYNVNGWISWSRMWEVVKHVFIIPLGVQKGLLMSWKRNRKKTICSWKNRQTQFNEQWKSMKAKNGPFSPCSFSGTDQIYFIDFQCSLSCVCLFFGCALFSYFLISALLLYFISNCDCSEMGFDGRILAQ